MSEKLAKPKRGKPGMPSIDHSGRPSTSRNSGDGVTSDLKRVEATLQLAKAADLVYDDASARRAYSWMTRLARGNKSDLRSNLFRLAGGKSVPYNDIIANFDQAYRAIMSQLQSQELGGFIDVELESGNRSKIGPKSMFLGYYKDGPDKVRAVMSDKSPPSQLDRQAFKHAIDRLVSEIESQSIRLHSVDRVLDTIRDGGAEHDPEAPGLDGTTNSGPPFYKSRWKVNPDMDAKQARETSFIENYIRAHAKRQFQALSRGELVTFRAMVGQRTVSRGQDPLSDPKVKRLIMALEKSEAVQWKMFTPIVQERLRYIKSPGGVPEHAAWCDAPLVDLAMQLMLDNANAQSLPVISGDISSFDTSVIPSLWEEMAFGMSDWFFKSRKFFSALNSSVIRRVKVLAPDGIYGPVPSSIKSGSGGTNFIDSQYNKLALMYGEELGLYKLLDFSVQGDDFVVSGPGIEPETVATAYKALGLSVHPDKQLVAKGRLNFLQRLHVRGSIGGMASVYRTLGACLVYEKLIYKSDEWNPYMEAIQTISKLENAAFHPAFEALVNFVRSGDKYELGANLDPMKVIVKAGEMADDLLASASRFTLNGQALDQSESGFGRAVTNGVLRGESLPPLGSRERYSRVYGSRRIEEARKYL